MVFDIVTLRKIYKASRFDKVLLNQCSLDWFTLYKKKWFLLSNEPLLITQFIWPAIASFFSVTDQGASYQKFGFGVFI